MRWRICSVLFFLASAVWAQRPARVGVGIIERKLTLDAALEAALKSNLDLEIERTNVAAAAQIVHAARGAFDGVFRWQPSIESRNSPTSSVLLGSDGKLAERFHTQNFSYSQRLPWRGSSLAAAFDNSRQSTTNPFVGLNPFLTSRLLIQYQQPLLRNRLRDRERTELEVRSRDVKISEVDLELRVIDVVTRVDYAYWDLVAARQDAMVKSDGVEWAREQLSRNERMIEGGTLARVELAAAQAELERRRDTYYASLAVVTEVENALKTLISGNRQDDLWNDEIVPAEERTPDASSSDDLRQAVSRAVEKRPELRRLSLRKSNNDTQLELARDQLKPRVDLVLGYAVSGLAGTQAPPSTNAFSQSSAIQLQRINQLSALAGLQPLPPSGFGGVPASLTGGYGSTLAGLFGGNFPTYQAGLSMDWTARNRAAEAGVAQASIAAKRLALERDRLEQSIAAEVRNAMQAIETARQRILAAEAGERAAKEKLDSETRLFQNGESTNFLVLTRQNEYSDSRRRVVVSRLDWNKSLSRLRQAMGTTLETRGIRVK